MYRHSQLYAVVSYITWIGFIIAYIGRDQADPFVRLHLNQAFILNLAAIIARLISRAGLLGALSMPLGIVCFVLSVMGIVRAANMDSRPLPLIGQIQILR